MNISEIMRSLPNLSNIIGSLLNRPKKLDLTKLPTQGFFYKKDFEIKIKKADLEDIIDYEHNFNAEDVYSIIESIKKIVRKNSILSKDYSFDDIKSVDIVFIFLEMVKFTANKTIEIPYYNEEMGQPDTIEFSNKTFNYFDFSKYKENVDIDTAEIVIDDYRFSMPSVGVENSLAHFLVNKGVKKWAKYKYDFTHFLANKRTLTFDEIENLVTIFNFEIDDDEKMKIQRIKDRFNPLVGYSLKKEGKVIELKSKLDLETIWQNKLNN